MVWIDVLRESKKANCNLLRLCLGSVYHTDSSLAILFDGVFSLFLSMNIAQFGNVFIVEISNFVISVKMSPF